MLEERSVAVLAGGSWVELPTTGDSETFLEGC